MATERPSGAPQDPRAGGTSPDVPHAPRRPRTFTEAFAGVRFGVVPPGPTTLYDLLASGVDPDDPDDDPHLGDR
jgi:hypothetical protein